MGYKKVKKMEFNQYYLWMTMLMFIQITVLSIATTSGNNNGRYFYFATPFFLYLILLETKDLFTITFLSVPPGKSNS